MTTVSDKKMSVDDDGGTVAYYNADAVNSSDYYPFGSLMPGRSYDSDKAYRYGFNGKENDNEVKGEGDQQDYGMRVYDPRLGRFLPIDPLSKSYPWYTPYQFAGNRPIVAIDLDGLEELIVHQYFNEANKVSKIQIMRFTDVDGNLQNNYMTRLSDGHEISSKVLVFNHRGNLSKLEIQEQGQLTKVQQEVLNKNLSIRSFSYVNGGHESFSSLEYQGEYFEEGNFITSSGTNEYPKPVAPKPVKFENVPIKPGINLSSFKGSNNYYIGVSNFPGAGDLGDEMKGSLSKLGKAIDQAGNIKSVTISITQVVGADVTTSEYNEAVRQANLALDHIITNLDSNTRSKVKFVNGGATVIRSDNNPNQIKGSGTNIKFQ